MTIPVPREREESAGRGHDEDVSECQGWNVA